MFLAYSMSKISEMFNPGIIYDLICNDLFIIFRIFDLIDTCDKTLINFILPLLDFIEECVSILDHDVGVIIDCGILETLEIILKQKNNCLIKKVLQILTSFRYENDKELGIMVLTTFRTIFLNIFSDSTQEVSNFFILIIIY